MIHFSVDYFKHYLFIGLFFTAYEPWIKNRELSNRFLKEFDFGKASTMNDIVLEQVQYLFSTISNQASTNNGVITVDKLFNAAIVNVTYAFLTGQLFKFGDPKLDELVQVADEWVASTNTNGVLGN